MPDSIFKPITFRPLTGPLDVRSPIDGVAPGSFRWKQNWSVNKDGKLVRAKGWKTPFNYQCIRNDDFHEQGVALAAREPMTLLFPSTMANGRRHLFGATKTRVLRLEEPTGLWTTLTGGPFGVDGTTNLTQLRFHAAELSDKVFFTNNFDPVQYHDLSTANDTIQPVPQLLTDAVHEDGRVLKAKVIISWNGVLLLMNVEQNNITPKRFPSRIIWSDLNNGLEWTVGFPSISDFQDLDYGHEILNAVPIGSSLFVFCDRSIWRCNFVVDTSTLGSGDTTLQCTRVYYEPKNKAKCLAYPNSLISDGRTAYYMGADDIYSYTPGYTPEPESPDWLRPSTGVIFNGSGIAIPPIDPRSCNSPISEARTDLNEIHFSWPVYDLLGTVVTTPDCDNFVPVPATAGTGVNRHTLVVNTKYKTADYRDYGSTAMANFVSDFSGVGECNQQSAFLSVNGADWTIKQLEIGYAREIYDPVAGSHTLTGYFSFLRGIFPFERFLEEKQVQSFIAGLEAEDPLDPAVARLRLGTSEIALDPNPVNPAFVLNGQATGPQAKCAVLFRQLKDQPIKCRATRTPEQYAVAGIKPDDPVQWNYLLRGRFLYFELTIAAADHTAPKTGGCAVSRFDVSARVI